MKSSAYHKFFDYKKFRQIWQNARQRCTNPKNPRYKFYGGRGIGFFITIEEIRDLWYRDNADNMKKPELDRKDNNGPYCLSNCHFIEKVIHIKKTHLNRGMDRTPLNAHIINYHI